MELKNLEELSERHWELVKLYLFRFMSIQREHKVAYQEMALKAMSFAENVNEGLGSYDDRKKAEQEKREQKEREERERKEREEAERKKREEERQREWDRFASLSPMERYQEGSKHYVLFDDLDDATQADIKAFLISPPGYYYATNRAPFSLLRRIRSYCDESIIETAIIDKNHMIWSRYEVPDSKKIRVGLFYVEGADGKDHNIAIQEETLTQWEKEFKDMFDKMTPIEQAEWGYDIEYASLDEASQKTVHEMFLNTDNTNSSSSKKINGRPSRKWHNFIIDYNLFKQWREERKQRQVS